MLGSDTVCAEGISELSLVSKCSTWLRQSAISGRTFRMFSAGWVIRAFMDVCNEF